MTAQAQFLFPTCRAAGLAGRAVLRNTARLGSGHGEAQAEHPVTVELAAWRDGERLFHDPAFVTLGLGDEAVVDAARLPALADDAETLVVARCRLEGREGYFPQEHQLTYSRAGRETHLLYDQLPIPAPGKPAAPIVLLGPKAWVGRDVNTYVVFASHTFEGEGGEHELEVTLLDPLGATLHAETRRAATRGVVVVDVRACVPSLAHGAVPSFVNVVARGGAAQFAILTFVVNERTGGCALEHSLSPHYYSKQDHGRLRREALVFEGGAS
jgi:hypothetical protein